MDRCIAFMNRKRCIAVIVNVPVNDATLRDCELPRDNADCCDVPALRQL